MPVEIALVFFTFCFSKAPEPGTAKDVLVIVPCAQPTSPGTPPEVAEMAD